MFLTYKIPTTYKNNSKFGGLTRRRNNFFRCYETAAIECVFFNISVKSLSLPYRDTAGKVRDGQKEEGATAAGGEGDCESGAVSIGFGQKDAVRRFRGREECETFPLLQSKGG